MANAPVSQCHPPVSVSVVAAAGGRDGGDGDQSQETPTHQPQAGAAKVPWDRVEPAAFPSEGAEQEKASRLRPMRPGCVPEAGPVITPMQPDEEIRGSDR